MAKLELKNIDYTYSPDSPYCIQALKQLSLCVNEGEFIGVIGHTGSGKSSLLQIMDALLVPTGGQVLLDGEDIWEKDYDIKKLRKKIGMVFQYPEYQLFEETVIKDVCFGPKNLGFSREGQKALAIEALELVGFPKEHYEQSPFFLSGGQKRKCAIAGILAMKPEILILDEPTAGLDPRGREAIIKLITRLNKEQNMTVIFVSHIMEDVASICDRVLVMHEGRLAMDAGTKEVFSKTDELLAMDLDIPVFMRVTKELNRRGIDVLPAMTKEEAASSILEQYRRRKTC